MKVLLITSGSTQSSISYREVAFGTYLAKEKYSTYLLSPIFDKYSSFKDNHITEINNIKVLRPFQPHFFPFDVSLLFYIVSAIWQIFILQPDIIHVYKPTPLTALALPFKWFFNKKLIFDTDDIDSEVMKIEKNPQVKIFLVTLSEKLLTYFSDAIICGSSYLKDYYQKRFPKKLIVHIPNGAEFKKNVLSSKNSIKEKIIFIGNINRINILMPLFFALKKLRKQNITVSTTIIGDGKYLSYFKQLTKTLSLSNVTFLGYIPRNQLGKYVSFGDIGYSYMPNELTQKACSNMKVFQYMQYGAIPLVSNIGDLPLYTYYGNAGYIAKHSNIHSLVHTIHIALTQRKERINKIHFALSHAKHDYNWSALGKRVKEVYQKIV